MKLEIYQEPEQREKVVRLKLVRDDDDKCVDLKADDGRGEWYLLSLYDDGRTLLYGLPDNLGFQLDGRGRIKFSDEE